MALEKPGKLGEFFFSYFLATLFQLMDSREARDFCRRFREVSPCCFDFTATTTVDFLRNSFIEWDFQDNFYAGLDKHGAHRTNLQLMFRTRQRGAGLLWKAQNAQKSEYLVLEVGFGFFLQIG